MANLNLGQDVANYREKTQTAAHIVAKSYLIWQAGRICCYGSLININPYVLLLLFRAFELCLKFLLLRRFGTGKAAINLGN